MRDAILFDTHTAIWFTQGTLPQEASRILAAAALAEGLLLSPVVAWEVGLLARSSRKGAVLGIDPGQWYAALLAQPTISECPLDGATMLASTQLPGEFHKDPADRFLIATARALDCSLMTRDAKILAYADQGHVRAIPC